MRLFLLLLMMLPLVFGQGETAAIIIVPGFGGPGSGRPPRGQTFRRRLTFFGRPFGFGRRFGFGPQMRVGQQELGGGFGGTQNTIIFLQ